jgi:hypothetical protein
MKTMCIFLLTIAAVGCGGYGSNSGTKPVTPMILTAGGLVPSMANAGDAGFNLAVNGSGFVGGSVVYWNGTTRGTTVVSGSKVMAAITDADLATAGNATVYVQNPGGTGIYMNQTGAKSNVVMFVIQ